MKKNSIDKININQKFELFSELWRPKIVAELNGVELRQGELLVDPRSVEHRTVADKEVEVIIFKPASTHNIGSAPMIVSLHQTA